MQINQKISCNKSRYILIRKQLIKNTKITFVERFKSKIYF